MKLHEFYSCKVCNTQKFILLHDLMLLFSSQLLHTFRCSMMAGFIVGECRCFARVDESRMNKPMYEQFTSHKCLNMFISLDDKAAGVEHFI